MILSPLALNRASLVLCCVGILDAGVLTASHLLQTTLPCGASAGCETVANDSSSYIGPVPIAAVGLGLYCLLLLITLARGFGYPYLRSTSIGLCLSGVGAGVSGWLTYHAYRDLGAVCPWCVASACTLALLFLTHLLLIRTPHAELSWTARDTVITAIVVGIILPGAFVKTISDSKRQTVRISLAQLKVEPLSSLIPAKAHIRGNLDAPVTIVEFADLSCPACRIMHQRLARLISHSSKIKLVFRQLPLSFLPGHSLSTYEAQLAESATSPQRFWQFVDQIYSRPGPITPTWVKQVAHQALGSTEIALGAPTAVQRDVDLATKLAIRQTPTYIILTPEGTRVPATSTDLLSKLSQPQVIKWITAQPQ